jgi:Rhodanese-related sulfurtransferase
MSKSPSPARVTNIDATTAISQYRSGLPVIDVREPGEWRAGHIPGALHLPLAKLTPDEVPNSGPVLVICRSGSRSMKAAKSLAAAGYEVGNVVGGITAWAAIGGPMETDTGSCPVVA